MTQTKNKIDSINTLVNNVAADVLQEYAASKLQPNELAITLIDLTSASQPEQGNYRGDEKLFPASVVKLFYLVAAHHWLEHGKLKGNDELARAMRDMIIESSNDATHYVLDLLTGTTGGPELPPEEMVAWSKRRQAVNEYFLSCGYSNINVVQKTWGDGPFGRERAFYGLDYENRNKLTTNATAKLLAEVATGKSVSAKRSKEMMDLLSRDFTKRSEDPDDQATGFIGAVLPPGAKLFSKAGWMSTARHDAAYVELANGLRFVLVVFNVNHAKEHGIVQSVARRVIDGLTAHHNLR